MAEPVGPPQLPDYEFVRELGRGGMGTVYLYRHAITQRPEVVKLLSPEVLAKPGNQGRFEREIRAAFKLSHPNIVAAYSTHRVGDSLAFCMEYVEGDDLSRLIQREGPLPAGEACAYIVQACMGLQHAYERGMVHRDIKPGNLMRAVVGGHTVVKVVDFGLAKLGGDGANTAESSLTQYGQVLGTPDFIAPEQIRNTSQADIRSDLYSLGCTLYFLLAGTPPFKGESLFDLFEMHIHNPPPDVNWAREGMPAGLAEAIQRMMAKNPADRPQTPAEAAELLTPFLTAGTYSHPSLGLTDPGSGPTAAARSGRTPVSQTRRPEPPPAESLTSVQFTGLSDTAFVPPDSTRYQSVKPAPTPGKTPGWLVSVIVAGVLLAAVAAAYIVFPGDETKQTEPTKPETPTTQAVTPPTKADTPPTRASTPQTTAVVRTPPTEMKTTPPTAPTKPPVPEWYVAQFGDPANGLKQTVWPAGEGWQLRDLQLVAPAATEDRVALLDLPPHGDFDLTAEVVVTGGAGLMVRGDRRAVDGQPTGYLIGLGESDAPAFACGAVHRWGVRNGRGKKLADGENDWAMPDKPVRVVVEGRGDRLNVQVNGHTAVQVRDTDGYTGGQLGLVTEADGSLTVTSLTLKTLTPPPALNRGSDAGFVMLVTPDRTTGWAVEGTERDWEVIGGVLVGRQHGKTRSTQGHVLTAATYGNFVLRFDYQLSAGGSALVSLRAEPNETVDAVLDGKPTKLLAHPWLRLFNSGEERLFRPPGLPADDKTFRPAVLERWFGSRVTRYPDPNQAVLDRLAPDAWHEMEIAVNGPAITVMLDGERVTYPTTRPDPKLNMPEFKAGQDRKTGRIGFAPFAGEVRFRNVRVKEQ